MSSDIQEGRDFEKLRRYMVDMQIRRRGIKDKRLLRVMEQIPREKFIPPASRYEAYEDQPVPIGYGQTISQPYMVALMTEALELQPEDRVLEIGTGSGYQTAILARLAKEIYTVERIAELSSSAQRVLAELGIDNVRFKVDDGTLGWPEYAPYDKIIVTAAAPHIPTALLEQLKEGGIMVIPVGPESYQTLYKVIKNKDRIEKIPLVECRFVKLIGKEGWR